MSWLLFMVESGHDHKTMPYEEDDVMPLSFRRAGRSLRDLAPPCMHILRAG